MNKIIIITGGKGNLGQYLTDKLNINNTVICLSHSDCDITSTKSIKKTVKNIIKKYKRIDVLINNAGIMKFDKVDDIKEKDIYKTFNVNTIGTINMTREVLDYMKRENKGIILNVSSIRGITGAPTKSIYSASKFALQGFSDSLRYELKDTNIKITNICGGQYLSSVTYRDIYNTIRYIFTLSRRTCLRNIILGGQL